MNDREFNLLSNGAIESFWDALWLELWPLLCSIVESRRIRVPMPSNELRCNFLVCGVLAGGCQFPRICACVGMGDMWASRVTLFEKILPPHRNFYEMLEKE